jgi:hypothetical protein
MFIFRCYLAMLLQRTLSGHRHGYALGHRHKHGHGTDSNREMDNLEQTVIKESESKDLKIKTSAFFFQTDWKIYSDVLVPC